jgi:intein/homing endonuclease
VCPLLLFVTGVNREIMEEGPNGLVAESLIKLFDLLGRKKNRESIEFRKSS